MEVTGRIASMDHVNPMASLVEWMDVLIGIGDFAVKFGMLTVSSKCRFYRNLWERQRIPQLEGASEWLQTELGSHNLLEPQLKFQANKNLYSNSQGVCIMILITLPFFGWVLNSQICEQTCVEQELEAGLLLTHPDLAEWPGTFRDIKSDRRVQKRYTSSRDVLFQLSSTWHVKSSYFFAMPSIEMPDSSQISCGSEVNLQTFRPPPLPPHLPVRSKRKTSLRHRSGHNHVISGTSRNARSPNVSHAMRFILCPPLPS